MEQYLQGNKDYWDKGYVATNVESHVFRMFGRILKYEFGQSIVTGKQIGRAHV